MLEYAEPVTKLIDELKRLPSIGHKSAQRLAFHIMRAPEADLERLIAALREVKQKIVLCSICNNLTEVDPCRFCSSPSRDHSVICVVEEPHSLVAVEKTRSFKGVYHVLLGRISPLEGVDPGDLTLDALVNRLESGAIKEVIMATNPNLEGDGTALHIQSLLARFPQITVTRLARGLPTGSNIKYANRNILADAISGRQRM